jgi:hypothetical protein
MPNSKVKELHRRQGRKRKLHYLRRRLARAEGAIERERLLIKIRRLSPRAPIAEYLASSK